MVNENEKYEKIEIQHRQHKVEAGYQAELKHLTEMVAKMSLHVERERINLASEIKDNIGQTLLLARIKIGMLSGQLKLGEYKVLLEDLRHILDLAIWEANSLSQRLYPALLTQVGLEPSLKWLGKQMEVDYGLRVEFADDGSEKPLNNVVCSIVYQAARELLLNVAMHAKSGAARISVAREGGVLLLRVEDRGVGFDAVHLVSDGQKEMNCKTADSGLMNLQRKFRNLGGDLTVISAPGKGASVTIRAPFI